MAKKGGGAPIPDPTAISAAQTTSNQQTAEQQAALNRVNSSGPQGTVQWQQSPDGTWSQNTTLSPEQQQLYDAQTRTQQALAGSVSDQLGRVNQSLGQGLDLSNLPALTGQIADAGAIQRSIGPTDFTADRQAVTDAVTDQAFSRLNPQFDQQNTALQNSLANQGIGINSAAYGNATDGLGRTQNDARNQAIYSGIQEGANEQNTLFNQALNQGQFANSAQAQQFGQNQDSATFQNNARQQGFQEQSYQQALPLNQLSQLMGLNPGVSAPPAIQYSPTSVAPTDVTGAYALQTQAQQAQAAQQQSASNGLLGGLFQLGAASLIPGVGQAALLPGLLGLGQSAVSKASTYGKA